MVEHNILQSDNHAGLPGGSTFKSIRILDTIRTDAIIHNKPLFIYFQDISKTYDRVCLDILKSAMLRLRIFLKLVNLILSVFTDHTNAVIIEFGFSSNYNVLIGIDQSEIISPLLWTIYYDPLLTRLKRNDIGYELSVLKYTDINASAQTIKISYTISAFLDDTELYTGATNALATQLNMTISFYRFTNIKVNDDKAILLMTDKTAADSDRNITLEGKKAQLIKRLRNIVRLAVMTMNRKCITPDHVVYLFNKVLIPQMEYLIQVDVLTKGEYTSIIAPMRCILCHKANLYNTLSNWAIYLIEPYGLKNFFLHQMTVHLDWLSIHLNDKNTLGLMSKIRIMQIQKKYWISELPFDLIRRLPKLWYRNNLLKSVIHVTKHLPINICLGERKLYLIHGGIKPLVKIIPLETYIKFLSTIRKYHIIFLKQINSPTNQLLS